MNIFFLDFEEYLCSFKVYPSQSLNKVTKLKDIDFPLTTITLVMVQIWSYIVLNTIFLNYQLHEGLNVGGWVLDRLDLLFHSNISLAYRKLFKIVHEDLLIEIRHWVEAEAVDKCRLSCERERSDWDMLLCRDWHVAVNNYKPILYSLINILQIEKTIPKTRKNCSPSCFDEIS